MRVLLVAGVAAAAALVGTMTACAKRPAAGELSPTRGPAQASAGAASTRTAGRAPRSALGINIGEVNYYTPQVVFLDLMKQAQDWGLNSGGEPPRVDAHGWPVALAAGRGAGFMARAPRAGKYVVLFDGDGDLEVSHGGRVVDTAKGRLAIELAEGAVGFTMRRTNADNPMRNIRIVPAEHERDHRETIFWPGFIERVRPFSTIRFLDFLRINNSPLSRWSERPTPEDFSQGTPKGVALEYAIDLCNRVKADCWINIPHMADDDYVRNAADLIAKRLDRGLRVYVEYSNEIWNFPHGDWVQRAGEKAGLPREWDTRLRYQARRSKRIFQLFTKAFGEGQRDRIVRVLAGQTWTLRLQILLDADDAYKEADAIAVAPYFCDELASPENAAKLRSQDGKSIADRCAADIERVRSRMREIAALARKYRLPVIGYEGGQHLATGGALHSDTALQQRLTDANRDPAMGQAYAQYLDMWRTEGGQLMVLYKLCDEPSIWGRWGLLEDLAQSNDRAPKYAAALDFIKRRPPWWGATRPE